MYRLTEADAGVEGVQGREAVVFLREEEIDGDTARQIRHMLQSPAVQHARIMPDCHYGNGCCVGFTSRLTQYTVPHFIGGDIGCGITVYPLDSHQLKKIRKRTENYCEAINSLIPVGVAKHATPRDIGRVYGLAQADALDFALTYKSQYETDLTSYVPTYDDAWFRSLMSRTGGDSRTVLRQLGTLGSGNHFIEVGEGPPLQDLTAPPVAYLSVHSGSRSLGQDICRFHGATGQPLTGEAAYRYYFDMIFAQCYARVNRWTMISDILRHVGAPLFNESQVIESTHNYIDFGDMIWRKGAVRSSLGQILVIALNMRDGILLAKGKGDPEWNQSAPHGAGRCVPRGKAHQHCTMKEFRTQMSSVCTRSVVPETLDESPAMYKSPDLIRERSRDTCEVLAQIKPIINVKGY